MRQAHKLGTATQGKHFSSPAPPAQTHLAVPSWEDDPEHLPILTHPFKFSLQLILNVCVAQHILHQILLQSAPQGPLIGIIKAEPADDRAESRPRWLWGLIPAKGRILQEQGFGDKDPEQGNTRSRPRDCQWDPSLCQSL